MPTVAELTAWLDAFAPSSLAEDWDNVGLLWGDPSATVENVMTCLTVTPETADEAIAGGAGLILSHHPVLFRAVKQIRADRGDGDFLWRLAKSGVAIASPHTAFDNTVGGINDGLASRLGLVDIGPLRPSPSRPECKVVVFVPESDHQAVLAAAFDAGAGRIGLYDECSFAVEGTGTFLGREGSDPTVGRAGSRESVPERRIELICPEGKLLKVVAAIRSAHSYEEPAIDAYPLKPVAAGPGSGRLGRLAKPEPLGTFANRVANLLGIAGVQIVGDPARPIERVAIVCGAGDDFVPDAARAGADVFLTGEARYHRGLEAKRLGMALVVAGHHATERPGVEDLADRLARDFPKLTVWASRVETDPFGWVRSQG